MVQKVLCIVLVLLWTMPLFMAKHSIKTKYITRQQVTYREEDEIINKPLSCTELICNEYQTDKDGVIDLSRSKQDTSIQYRRQQKDEVKRFIPKLVARPEYGTVYQHQVMLLQNLHRHYLYIFHEVSSSMCMCMGYLNFKNR